MRPIQILFIGILLFGIFAQKSFADDTYTFIVKKQEDKDKYRWNLSDWLVTRDNMRLQDLWLAIHSPSPYEFYFGANYQSNQVIQSGSQTGWEISAGAYSSIVGLEGRYEAINQETHTHGIFNLRFFGFHDQSTNITLQLGIRNTSNAAQSYRNALAGLSMTLYFARSFGLEGLYRYYFSSSPTISGIQYTGEKIQGGAFIDFSFLRIFGDYIVDNETTSNMTGFQVGTKLYF